MGGATHGGPFRPWEPGSSKPESRLGPALPLRSASSSPVTARPLPAAVCLETVPGAGPAGSAPAQCGSQLLLGEWGARGAGATVSFLAGGTEEGHFPSPSPSPPVRPPGSSWDLAWGAAGRALEQAVRRAGIRGHRADVQTRAADCLRGTPPGSWGPHVGCGAGPASRGQRLRSK